MLATFNLLKESLDYMVDTAQRSILFWDTMRERGNTFLEHSLSGKPPVLDFDYELMIDGRTLERPVNYSLLRIIPQEGYPVDKTKRPIIIVDPRAGHGPGVGGSKPDSQVGVAMRSGHPVYFVTFSAMPIPGQTLEDIGRAEAIFIEKVTELHPLEGMRPAVVGNCQAGWAVASLAAIRPDIMGPLMLNGAPLSYWAGNDKQNNMKYTGGLVGGKWLATFALDIGNGLFDGANLVANFETLNPANTLWNKEYFLYKNIDTEAKRYLDFEKWWSGFFFYDEDEYQPIVGELFIGNKLAKGKVITNEGIQINLKNIKSPIVVFASWGDDITPPQQALNWIIDAYGHEDAIVSHEQVIVYLLHEDIGHLGIFVSGAIARKEHSQLFSSIELIDSLPPGLYEMVIDKKNPKMVYSDLEPGDYTVRIERRTVADIRELSEGPVDERPFNAVAAVSEINDTIYKSLFRPFVRAMSTEVSARLMRAMHPLRMQRAVISDLNPALFMLPYMATLVRMYRRPVKETNYFFTAQEDMSQAVTDALNLYRDTRDGLCRHMFKLVYGPFGVGAYFPETEKDIEPMPVFTTEEAQQLEADFAAGGFADALVRMIIAVKNQDRYIDRRSGYLAEKVWQQHPQLKHTSVEERKRMIKVQSRVLHFDEARALQTLPKLLKKKAEREEAFQLLSYIMLGHEDMGHRFEGPVVSRIAEILNVQKELPLPVH